MSSRLSSSTRLQLTACSCSEENVTAAIQRTRKFIRSLDYVALAILAAGCATPQPTSSMTSGPPACGAHCIGPGTIVSAVGGFTLVLTEKWLSGGNTSQEFAISPLDVPDDEILFWLDVSPSTKRDEPVTGVPTTPRGLYDWLAADPDLTVSTTQPVTIGDRLPAIAFDLRVSDTAVNLDPNCPGRACVDFLWHTPPWSAPFGISDRERLRIYLAHAGRGAKANTLVTVVSAVDDEQLTAFAPRVSSILASIRLPADLRP
jgi:hypothetical protein